MELSQIEAFERVAREGNFTRAADSLGLTQPAVSTRIALLEAELGGKLFERGGRELSLSPLGERLLPYAQRMLSVMADGLQAAEDFHYGRLGEVKIAAPTPFVLSFLVEALEQFRHQHPSVDILIRERNKTTIFDMLADNAITLGLVNAPVYDRKYTHYAKFADPIRAVVAASHPLAQQPQPMRMDAIYTHTIFRVSMFPQMTAFVDEVVEHGRQGSGGAVIAVPMVMAYHLVRKGEGVTFLPESYVKSAVESGELTFLEIADMPELMSQPVLIAPRDRRLDDIHLEFVRILKTCWRHLLVE
jgi:LysR family cyn operon transcriptional activator